MNKPGRILARTAALLMALFLAYGIGWLCTDEQILRSDYARTALLQTGLPADAASVYALHGEAWGRDSFEQTAFCIDHYDEAALLELMKRTAGWRIADVSAQDYRRFAEAVMWTYQETLQLQDDTVFDAWYYREKAEPHNTRHAPDGPFEEIGQIGRGFIFAVYDEETGLFIYTEQFG